ncbi:hypothetical protein BGZ63DRAFT_467390 [Mariannaea sp. PMI_226]|nr:hypothetical protein BGZ63DRAFT_467390 [Mariannaea sp. PMI_226]
MKVALVTASSAGLGAATAKALAGAGMRVVINFSSNAERAAEVIENMSTEAARYQRMAGMESTSSSDTQLRFLSIRADLSKRSDIERLITETVEKMGRLDIVVSNGGWTRIRKFDDLDQNVDEEDWDMCFNINVKSHLYLLQAARPHLEITKGSFTTIASVAGVKPSGSSIPYAVTKAAQIHMVKCLARAVAPTIRVNSVSPGILMTDWGRQFSEEHLQGAREATALKRFATLEDVSQAVMTLATNQSMTGHNLVIDAGFVL